MDEFNAPRVRPANDHPVRPTGKYVVYWCNLSRRLRANHAFDYALELAKRFRRPLVVYESLRLVYPWANARTHKFVLDGIRDNARDAKRLGVHHWPYVETPDVPGPGPLLDIARDACVVVTDEYPQYLSPALLRRTAAATEAAVHVVDTNSVIPLAKYGPTAAVAAAHFRFRVHKLFGEAWAYRAAAEPDVPTAVRKSVDPPFRPWKPPADLGAFVRSLPVDQSVPPVAAEGGSAAGARLLADFVARRLPRYTDERNQPSDPAAGAASGLSWYLHYGHVGVQEVCEAVLGPDWTPAEINPKTRNKDDFFCRDANVNAFLDEAVTWRDLGYHWNQIRDRAVPAGGPAKCWVESSESPSFNFVSYDFSPLPVEGALAGVLPEWAKATLAKHAADRRDHLYTLEQFEAGDTHDELWNSAQAELVGTGRMHNYMRMLWGKKVLEWSESPEAAYRVLEHLNNKYAIDGRDPNSYSGILWCFGLFDRPWPPDRRVTGVVRYMSSENTARKFDLTGYLDYVKRFSTPSVPDPGPAGGNSPGQRKRRSR